VELPDMADAHGADAEKTDAEFHGPKDGCHQEVQKAQKAPETSGG
jgi:hypothetical protein